MLNPNFTVDYSVNSFNNSQVAIEFCKKLKACLKDSNFELRKWATKNCVMQKYIYQKHDHNDSETYFESLYGTSYQTALGLNWKRDSDAFIFDLGFMYDAARNLKRNQNGIKTEHITDCCCVF